METQHNQTQEEREIELINQKVQQYIEPLKKDLDANELTVGDTGVYKHNNAWVLKEHHYTPQNFDFTIGD